MNANKGLMQIATVVRVIGYLLSAGVVATGLTIAYQSGVTLGGVASTIGVAALLSGAGWALSWIIEGIAKPKP